MDFSRLGNLLHLEIQKGKEAMKASNFQRDIGGTVACMKRLMMATKEFDQLRSNNTYFSDSWFCGVKIVEEAMAELVNVDVVST